MSSNLSLHRAPVALVVAGVAVLFAGCSRADATKTTTDSTKVKVAGFTIPAAQLARIHVITL
ncbi:MAG TPA: hypothetical protein VGL17_13980, partial [Gemmatimonadaceae bacterium]